MPDDSSPVVIVGAGLAGCECAWQLAERGVAVILHEMRPQRSTPAHKSGDLAELVCSNSLRSDDPQHAAGLLKRQMESFDSLIIAAARRAAVPADNRPMTCWISVTSNYWNCLSWFRSRPQRRKTAP